MSLSIIIRILITVNWSASLLVNVIELLQRPKQLVNFLGFEFELSQLRLEYHECSIQVLDALAELTELEADERVGHVGLRSQQVVRTEFSLEELPYDLQVLECLLVVVLVDNGLHWVLHILQVFFDYEFLPDC